MGAKFMLLITTAILLIIAKTHESNLFYILTLFAWSGYLIKPIKDDVEDIKTTLKHFKKQPKRAK